MNKFMNQQDSTIANPSLKIPDKLFQPAGAWIAILGFSIVSLMLIGLGGFGARILNILFPAASLALGWLLYFRYPVLYNGFVWWLFFLTPFLRRICDWRIGAFTESSSSYILLAPFLAILVSAHSLHFNLSKTREQGTMPFVLAIAAVIYGYVIAMIHSQIPIVSVGSIEAIIPLSPIRATVALLEWISPLLFGYHLLVNWERYPAYSQNVKRVFLWGALIMGIYGIYQFLVAPEWDRLWMIGSGMDSSAGSPVPFGMRVWSTMNSQGPFGDYMVTGLLLLLGCQGNLVAPAAGVGALSLLLSLVRAAWIGWFLGMISLVLSLTPKQKFRIALTLIILTAIIIPLTTIEPFSTTIGPRLATLSNLQDDGSSQVRQATYAILINDALSKVIGEGIGSFDTDSAILVLFFNLGWIGVIPYMGGLIFASVLVFTSKTKNNNDIFIPITRGILIKSLMFLLASPTMRGAHGVILWGFLGLGLAGRKYYQNYYQQQILSLISNRSKSQ